ncbi:MAG: TadE/TadG family type IV pilus assembly protein [Pseudomonadota bacterium]
MRLRISDHPSLEKASHYAGLFKRDRRGVSAVEFAFILPTIMIPLYFGAVEVSEALTVDRRITSIASTVADLTAQAEEVDSGQVNQIFDAARSIMVPYDNTGITIVLTSVVADEDNNTTVDWSCGHGGGTTHAEGSAFTLPPNLTQPFTSVIVAEVNYTHNSFLAKVLDSPISMKDTFYLRPRRSLTVEFTGGGC